MELKISKLDVPRVTAIHKGNDDAIASFLGTVTVFVTTILKTCGVDPSGIAEEDMRKAVIMVAEAHAEIMFNTVKAIQTQSGPAFIKDMVAAESEADVEGGGDAAE